MGDEYPFEGPLKQRNIKISDELWVKFRTCLHERNPETDVSSGIRQLMRQYIATTQRAQERAQERKTRKIAS